jgi:hypothetical protein
VRSAVPDGPDQHPIGNSAPETFHLEQFEDGQQLDDHQSIADLFVAVFVFGSRGFQRGIDIDERCAIDHPSDHCHGWPDVGYVDDGQCRGQACHG